MIAATFGWHLVRGQLEIAVNDHLGYNTSMSDWNPLYPFNEDVDPLEEAAREVEWEDDCRRTARNKRRKKRID